MDVAWKKYDSPESIVQAFFASFGNEKPDSVGGTTMEGDDVIITPEEMTEGIKEDGVWGFSDTQSNTIHYWIAEDTDPSSVAWFMGHELAHLKIGGNGDLEEENMAEQVGEITAEVYKLIVRKVNQ